MSVQGWDFSISARLAAARDRALTRPEPPIDPMIMLIRHMGASMEEAEQAVIRLIAQIAEAFEDFTAMLRTAFQPLITFIDDEYTIDCHPPIWSTAWWARQHGRE